MRRAATLIEVTIVLSIAGLLAGLVAVPAARLFDGIQVRSAVSALSAACALARAAAIARSAPAEVALVPGEARVLVIAGADTLSDERLGSRFGITLEATASRIRYSPLGHGWGLSNARIIARRGRAADTLVVSRLGRVRR